MYLSFNYLCIVMLPKNFCVFTADNHNLLKQNTHFAVKWILMFVMEIETGQCSCCEGFDLLKDI